MNSNRTERLHGAVNTLALGTSTLSLMESQRRSERESLPLRKVFRLFLPFGFAGVFIIVFFELMVLSARWLEYVRSLWGKHPIAPA
jgi:hypothetical protein